MSALSLPIFNSGICITKRLNAMLVYCRLPCRIFCSGTAQKFHHCLFIFVAGGESHCSSEVSCPRTQHDKMGWIRFQHTLCNFFLKLNAIRFLSFCTDEFSKFFALQLAVLKSCLYYIELHTNKIF